ncbi:MAG: hypothetical protein NVS9B10_17930 [Nevskia sp.]
MSFVFATGVVLALIFGLAALIAFAFVALDARTAGRMRRRLGLGGAADSEDFTEAGDQKLLQGLAKRGQSLERIVDKEGETPLLLARAGWRSPQARLLFYALQGLLPLLLGVLVLAGWASGNKLFQGLNLYAAAFGAVALAFLIPRWVLRRAASARQKRIKNEVPLFVHLLVLLFEAGLSTRQALASLVREGAGVLPELGAEFDSIVRQLDTGADTGESLRQLGDTLAVGDLSNILGVLRQVDRYGGEIREPLLDTLKVLEERRSLDLRERVNLISGRMTVVMVLFFFPALLIFVAGPAALAITTSLSSVASGK